MRVQSHPDFNSSVVFMDLPQQAVSSERYITRPLEPLAAPGFSFHSLIPDFLMPFGVRHISTQGPSLIPKVSVRTPVPPPSPEPPQAPAMLRCAVCLTLAGEQTPLSSTLCGHIFCQDCLQQALSHNKVCPTCRKSLAKKGSHHRIYL
ncbi:hypothetical protein HK105_202629 [Polyrhizophydium stewartii]|uniref:RING-type domain-containing protein n=1 Tax=Polyrhizophydium stewartii TaxID=2732419 RepID=A0ABR4NDZ9_9FUNG